MVFGWGSFGKNLWTLLKEQFNTGKLAKFESDTFKAREDTAPQSRKTLQASVWCGANWSPPSYNCL